MHNKPKKSTLLLLAIASLGLSRIVFLFIHDPEGPNLVVVLGLALIIFLVSLGIYSLVPKAE
jgi:hypothetical protein